MIFHIEGHSNKHLSVSQNFKVCIVYITSTVRMLLLSPSFLEFPDFHELFSIEGALYKPGGMRTKIHICIAFSASPLWESVYEIIALSQLLKYNLMWHYFNTIENKAKLLEWLSKLRTIKLTNWWFLELLKS